MSSIINRLKFYDIPLLVVSGLLLVVGLAVQYAISLGEGSLEIFYRQAIFAVGAIITFTLVANYNYQLLSKQNRIFYVVLVVALLYLVLFGDPIRGSARWIELGFFRLQPAELAKIIIAIGLSRWLYLNRGQINSWKNILSTFIYVAIPAVLIALEPDLGSTIIVLAIWFGIILLSPIKRIYIAAFIIIALLFSGFAWAFLLQDYQIERIEVFLDPDKDPRGKGYNVRQAIIAVGSGQWFGRGLGQGVQSGLKFLPEKHTDFIFASTSEEIGLLGSVSILILFMILMYRIQIIMRLARDDLGMYIAGGVFFFFASQVIINIGMNIGLLPVTGIPLPFLTYGGSSMLVTAIALGVVQNIAKQSKVLRF